MSGYTPGPWLVKGTPGRTLCVTDQDSRYIVDRFLLGDRPPGEHLANARAISSVPEALAACRAFLAGADSGEVWDLAAAAVAKADAEGTS